MRASSPMPFTTWVTSAPASSQMLAMALMNEILVARKALEAYLIISADGTSVMIIGRSSGAYSSSRVMATCWRRGADHDPVGSERVLDRRALAQELGIGDDVEGDRLALVALDDLADELAGPDRAPSTC